MDEWEGLDRDAFEQVWDRVMAGREGPVEVLPAPGQGDRENDGRAARLQELVMALLSDASVYRDLSRRTSRARGELAGLVRGKTAQARTLSAACFLLTGVRYWPVGATPVNPPEGLFAALRRRYLAEGRLAGELEAMAEAGPAEDRALWRDLAAQTRTFARTVRAIVEREM